MPSFSWCPPAPCRWLLHFSWGSPPVCSHKLHQQLHSSFQALTCIHPLCCGTLCSATPLQARLSTLGADAHCNLNCKQNGGHDREGHPGKSYFCYIYTHWINDSLWANWETKVTFARCIESLHDTAAAMFAMQRQQAIAGALAFWMANSSELLNFLKHDKDLSSLTRQSQLDLSRLVHKAYRYRRALRGSVVLNANWNCSTYYSSLCPLRGTLNLWPPKQTTLIIGSFPLQWQPWTPTDV